MDRRDDLPERLPLPSEDEGDLLDAPAEGETDDPWVATEEGVPYVPPTDRVLTGSREDESGPDYAGSAPSAEQELEADELEPSDLSSDAPARDEPLLAEALAALRRSDLAAGDRIEVDAAGSTIFVRGAVESIEIAEEIDDLLNEIPGVSEVVDELEVDGR
jgi:BON domain